jgi:hypothetical protein
MGSPVVLILTHPADVHADAVQEHLDAAGVPVHRLDTAGVGSLACPVTAHVGGGVVTGDVAGVSLAGVAGVWHRRPSYFTAPDARDAAELRAGVGGILATLPYLNHPADMAVAAFKPYQLVRAAGCGRPAAGCRYRRRWSPPCGRSLPRWAAGCAAPWWSNPCPGTRAA